MKGLVLTLLAALATAAHAQATERPLWELGLGAGVLQLPHYRGSDQSHTWLLPVPYVVYRGEILKADREGARAVLYESTRLNFDLSASAGAPTRSEDNHARRGMADLPPTVELGPNLNWTLVRGADWKLDARVPLRAAVTVQRSPHHIGWIATPNLNLDHRGIGGWHIGLQGALVYADRSYNAHFYEVGTGDALADRPAYRAPGGFGGTQLTLATSRRFADTWVGAFVRHDSLQGAGFAASPLVRERSQWSAGIALSWVFASSSRSLPVAE